jgi:hypothetical protein
MKIGVQFRVCHVQIGLTRQEALRVNRAGGHEADAFAVRVDHRVAVVRHAHALVVEAEADDTPLRSFSRATKASRPMNHGL